MSIYPMDSGAELVSYNVLQLASPTLANLPIRPSPRQVICVGIDLKVNAREWVDIARNATTKNEQRRAANYHHAEDGFAHLVGRALARMALGLSPLRDFPRNAYGKPMLIASKGDFSISHSGHFVWCAFCLEGKVGIDVEKIDQGVDLASTSRYFHPDEQREIHSLDYPEKICAFYRCWTRKEAIVKAIGQGLSCSLDSFVVSTAKISNHWLKEPPAALAAEKWKTADLFCGTSHQCSIATTGNIESFYALELACHQQHPG